VGGHFADTRVERLRELVAPGGNAEAAQNMLMPDAMAKYAFAMSQPSWKYRNQTSIEYTGGASYPDISKEPFQTVHGLVRRKMEVSRVSGNEDIDRRLWPTLKSLPTGKTWKAF
jgi:hypothetical protein